MEIAFTASGPAHAGRLAAPHAPLRLQPTEPLVQREAQSAAGSAAASDGLWWRVAGPTLTAAASAVVVGHRQRRVALRRSRMARRAASSSRGSSKLAAAAGGTVEVSAPPVAEMPEELEDIAVAGRDVNTPHWSDTPSLERKAPGLRVEQLDWKDAHGIACQLSGVLFLAELVRFVQGQPPSDMECYFAAVIYAVIYASRFEGIRYLEPHFRVTFYATTGWTIYYIAHLLAATNPDIFAHLVYPTGIVFLASTIYFYKHWLERMYRHYVQDRFRAYYLPGLMGLMYFHGLDCADLFNQWLDPNYWTNVPMTLPDQAWTIQDVRLTGLFMSSMALFMITLHNKGVLSGGANTLITVLFTIFVPAFFLTGTHMNLQASFP